MHCPGNPQYPGTEHEQDGGADSGGVSGAGGGREEDPVLSAETLDALENRVISKLLTRLNPGFTVDDGGERFHEGGGFAVVPQRLCYGGRGGEESRS